MSKYRFNKFSLFFYTAISFLVSSQVSAEDITLTTYYPSPRGVYNELRTTNNTYLSSQAGNTAVGTETPNAATKFSVAGNIAVGTNYGLLAAPANGLIVEGNVGIGTTAPTNLLSVAGGASVGNGYTGNAAPNNGLIVQGRLGVGTSAPTFRFHVVAGGDAAMEVRTLRVGSPLPAAGAADGLRVNGNIRTSGSFFCNSAMDVAENFPWSPSQPRLPGPGDVVSIAQDQDESLTLSALPYDATVAGVVSDNPGMLLGAEVDGYTVALAGRVPTKVTAENGPIKRGDLLVTATKPGYAMRGDAQRIEAGMVLGKALGELASGEGLIVALINLQ